MPALPFAGALLARQFVPAIKECASMVCAESVLDFGPVFLPSIPGLANIPCGKASPYPTGKTLAVSCFALSQLASDALAAQLEFMHKAAPFVLLADAKMAERNIELPASLFIRGMTGLGASKKGCFKEYGGLEGLLYAQSSRFAVRKRYSFLGGSLACILAECIR